MWVIEMVSAQSMLLCNKSHSSHMYSPSWGCKHTQLTEPGPAPVLCLLRAWLEGAAAGNHVRAPAQASRRDFRVCLLHPDPVLGQSQLTMSSCRGYINNGFFTDSFCHLCCPTAVSAQQISAASLAVWKQNTLAVQYFVSALAHIYTCSVSSPPAVLSIQTDKVSLACSH